MTIEERLRAVEDRLAIYQVVATYGYAIDGCNTEVVGSLFDENGTYAVGDFGTFRGREAIEGVASSDGHLALVAAGCGHLSTLPYVVITGEQAVATCHTMVVHGDGMNGYVVGRLSASRIELSRQASGEWKIDHRQNHLLRSDGLGAALLARLQEPPAPAAGS